MLKGKITQDEFNEIYVEYRRNYKHWSNVNVTFEMVCKLHGIGSVEFEDRMNYLDNNPPAEIEDLFMTPTVDIEEKIKMDNGLDDEGEYIGGDEDHIDFIDENFPENESEGDIDGEDSNEY